jgi:hypothetical protein
MSQFRFLREAYLKPKKAPIAERLSSRSEKLRCHGKGFAGTEGASLPL